MELNVIIEDWIHYEIPISSIATSFTKVGCFKDTSSRAISGGKVIFPANSVIQKCFERAKEAGNEYFGVQYNVECFTSKDAGSTYNKYGKGSGCKNGRGGGWLMTVYRINQKGTHSEIMAWRFRLHTRRPNNPQTE